MATTMFCASEQLQLSHPSPMRTPARCRSRIGGMPHFILRLPCGLSTTPAPLSARRLISSGASPTEWGGVGRGVGAAWGGEPPKERAAMLGKRQARLQRHAARFIDVGIDRDVVAARELHGACDQRRRAAFGLRGAEPPMPARPWRRLEAGRLEMTDEIELALGLGRARGQRGQILRKDPLTERK